MKGCVLYGQFSLRYTFIYPCTWSDVGRSDYRNSLLFYTRMEQTVGLSGNFLFSVYRLRDWISITFTKVWRKAAEQMFFSLSISWGGLIMFGSYNQFRNRVHIDAFIVSSLDFITSLIAGVATFSILGAISLETGVDIKEIATAGIF